MNNLDQNLQMFQRNGFEVKVADAPQDAATFDKMIILLVEGRIRRVIFYDSKTDAFVAAY